MRDFKELRWNLKCQMKDRYARNKMKRIGQTCICPACGKKFVKKTRAQAFCGSRYDTTCKDAYWNFIRFSTIPMNYFGYFKILKPTDEEMEEHVEYMCGDGSDITDEDKKFTDMLIESIELGNEEKEESKTDDSVPEDDYVDEEDSYLI